MFVGLLSLEVAVHLLLVHGWKVNQHALPIIIVNFRVAEALSRYAPKTDGSPICLLQHVALRENFITTCVAVLQVEVAATQQNARQKQRLIAAIGAVLLMLPEVLNASSNATITDKMELP